MGKVDQPPVVAYLAVRGALDAIALYEKAFGATLLIHKMADDEKRVLHAALDIFGTMVMLSDEFPEYASEVKGRRRSVQRRSPSMSVWSSRPRSTPPWPRLLRRAAPSRCRPSMRSGECGMAACETRSAMPGRLGAPLP